MCPCESLNLGSNGSNCHTTLFFWDWAANASPACGPSTTAMLPQGHIDDETWPSLIGYGGSSLAQLVDDAVAGSVNPRDLGKWRPSQSLYPGLNSGFPTTDRGSVCSSNSEYENKRKPRQPRWAAAVVVRVWVAWEGKNKRSTMVPSHAESQDAGIPGSAASEFREAEASRNHSQQLNRNASSRADAREGVSRCRFRCLDRRAKSLGGNRRRSRRRRTKSRSSRC